MTLKLISYYSHAFTATITTSPSKHPLHSKIATQTPTMQSSINGVLGATACCFDDGGLSKCPGVSCGPGNTPTLVLAIGLAESQELSISARNAGLLLRGLLLTLLSRWLTV